MSPVPNEASAQSNQSLWCALRIPKVLWFLHVDSEDSDQTRQIRVFAGRTSHSVVFFMHWLILPSVACTDSFNVVCLPCVTDGKSKKFSVRLFSVKKVSYIDYIFKTENK